MTHHGWNWLAIAYMTTFFSLVAGVVVYAIVELVRGDRREERRS